MEEFIDHGARREAEDRKRSLKALRELLVHEMRTTRRRVGSGQAAN